MRGEGVQRIDGRGSPARERTARRMRDLLEARDAARMEVERLRDAWGLVDADRWRVVRERDELRAVLAPLLDDPFFFALCMFCECDEYSDHTQKTPTPKHSPDCPALPANRDRLLGRDRAPTEPEAT